jgi:hypothetical protein
MKGFADTLLTIAVLGGILLLSGVITRLFTNKMYYRCHLCSNLNAKRRTHCRICGELLTR